MPHVIDDAAGVAVHLVREVLGSFVLEPDLEAPIEERHHLEAFEDGLGAELCVFEDRRIRPERDHRARSAPRRRSGDLERTFRVATVGKLHPMPFPVPVDLEYEPGRQGVHDRHPDTVESAGHLVARAPELSAGVQHREHDLCRASCPDTRAWGRPECPSRCRPPGNRRRRARLTSIRVQYPAIASSTALSTSSRIRW